MKDFTEEDGRSVESPDEKHMMHALFLIQKAIAMHAACQTDLWPMIHANLRDAAEHCEKARQFWTQEAREEIRETLRKIGVEP